MTNLRFSVAVCALALAACGGAPAQPTAATAVAVPAAKGALRASNSAPILILKTRPVADKTTLPYWTIQGVVPLSVRFNLCPSDDVDQIYLPDGTQDPRGDSLNWQFNFGDVTSKLPPFSLDGKFQPDFDQYCRVDHVYEKPGSYVATVSVTDKHVEDQSRDAAALARTTTHVAINVFPTPPPVPSDPGPSVPSGPPVILSFIASAGCEATLSWTTQNATSAMITPIYGAVTVNGVLTHVSDGRDYTLTITGPGGTTSRTVHLGSC